MTQEETKKLLAGIASIYPPNLMPQVTGVTIAMWHKLLEDIPNAAATNAMMAWSAAEKYPPAVSDIRRIAVESTLPDRIPADEAWGRLRAAIRKYGNVWVAKARDELGADIWAVVERFGWNHYCMMDERYNDQNFRTFKAIWDREGDLAKRQAMVPETIRSSLRLITSGGRDGG